MQTDINDEIAGLLLDTKRYFQEDNEARKKIAATGLFPVSSRRVFGQPHNGSPPHSDSGGHDANIHEWWKVQNPVNAKVDEQKDIDIRKELAARAQKTRGRKQSQDQQHSHSTESNDGRTVKGDRQKEGSGTEEFKRGGSGNGGGRDHDGKRESRGEDSGGGRGGSGGRGSDGGGNKQKHDSKANSGFLGMSSSFFDIDADNPRFATTGSIDEGNYNNIFTPNFNNIINNIL